MMCHVQMDQFVDCRCKVTCDWASGVHSALTGLWARMGVLASWGEGGWGRAACVLEALSMLCMSNMTCWRCGRTRGGSIEPGGDG